MIILLGSLVITFFPVGSIFTGIFDSVVRGFGIKYGFTRGEGNTLKYVVYCWKENLSMHQITSMSHYISETINS